MKIRIELTGSEVNKLRKISTNIVKEVSVLLDSDFTKQDEKEFKEKFNNYLDTDIKTKIGSINSYDSSVENISGKGKIINIDVKSAFTNSMLDLVGVFYSGMADFILRIKEPFEKFFNKYLY